MKRKMMLAVLLTAALFAAGCSKKEKETEAPAQTETKAQTEVQTEAKAETEAQTEAAEAVAEDATEAAAVEMMSEAEAAVESVSEDVVTETEAASEAETDESAAEDVIVEEDSEEASEEISEEAEEATLEEIAERPEYRALDYVTLGQYTGLSVEVDAITVTDEDVQSAIESAVANSGEYNTLTEGTVQEGDIANIDYEGKKDGVAFDGGTAQGYDLTIGSGMFIEGFEAGLVGTAIGDTVDLNLTFPENYASEELAGQDVVFTVTVNSVKRTPEITDEVISKVSDGAYSTIDGYREYQRGQVQAQKEEAQEGAIRTELMTQLYNTCTVENYPEELISYSVDTLRNYYTQMASYYGMEFADFLPLYFGIDEATFETESSEAVKESLQQEMILKAIAEQEDLQISDEEFTEGCKKYADRMGYPTVEEFTDAYGEKEIRQSLIMDKAMDFVKENALITIREIETEAATEAQTDAEPETEAAAEAPAETEAETEIQTETVTEGTTEA
ncbi:MAG: trigger factor [Lachnospiraceae bacterium]|nr:trigger factor [Lachnospiraceae bacterium]